MALRILHVVLGAVLILTVDVSAQTAPSAGRERSGAELYRAACASCHGADGKGEPKEVVGFDAPVPDFTDCGFSSPEPAADWATVVRLGGPVRAFDRQMPAFGDALTGDEIARVTAHVRGLCTDAQWPRGDLNLPRPLVTEKAFPENEAVVTTAVTAGTADSVGNKFVYEHRLGRRGQYEVIVPLDLRQNAAGSWRAGLGDVAVAYKHVAFHSLDRGAILSGGAELILPTGRRAAGLGGGVTVFEPFAAFSQILPRDGFLHLHAGFELPSDRTRANREVFWRAAVGRTFSEGGWGRAWSPMVELLAVSEAVSHATTEWDFVPEMQVTLSTRQHIMINAGVRLPLNQRTGRSKALMAYFLWDWFDGGLLSGW